MKLISELFELILTLVASVIASLVVVLPLVAVFLLTMKYTVDFMAPNHIIGEWHYVGESSDMEACGTRSVVDVPLDQSEHSIVFRSEELLINDVEYKVKNYDFLDGKHGPRRVVVMLASGEGLLFEFNGHNQLVWKNGPWEGPVRRGAL